MGDQDIIIRNVTEELVESHLDQCIAEAQACSCARCRADILAYALNQLLPHYVVTTKGDLFVRVDAMTTQGQADIIAAIMNGVKTVRENPRHL